VLDGRGNLVVTSRIFPTKQINHLTALVTGLKRLTFSQPALNPIGSMRTIVVVVIYTCRMDILYAEAAKWPGSPARCSAGVAASKSLLLDTEQHATIASPATIITNLEARTRLVSWNHTGGLSVD
jgi:hypothetical protein